METMKAPILAIMSLGVLLMAGCGDNGQPKQRIEADTQTDKQSSEVVTEVTETVAEVDNDANILTYKVGMDVSYPPYNMSDEHGQPAGFDLEILQAIADHEGFQLSLLPKKWNKLLMEIEAGNYDIVVGGFSAEDVSDQAGTHYTLSQPYTYTHDAIAITNQNIKISTFEDLKGHKVSTLADTSWVTDLTELQGNPDNIVQEKTSFLALQELIQNNVDASLNNQGVFLHYKLSMPEYPIDIVGKGDYFEPYGLVILSKKDNPTLNQQINDGIAKIVKDGTYTKIYKKWFGVSPESLPATN